MSVISPSRDIGKLFALGGYAMKYMVRKSYIDVLGLLWMPQVKASLRVKLDSFDIENARDDAGTITRDSLEQWLMTHSGDFSSVIDFTASIEDGEATIDIPWSSEENECAYTDTLGEMD